MTRYQQADFEAWVVGYSLRVLVLNFGTKNDPVIHPVILSTYRVAFRTARQNEVKGTDMMYEFLTNNRAELERRCREKVSHRPGRTASSTQLQNGVPLFLDQLIRTLAVEQTQNLAASHAISGPAGGMVSGSEMGGSAAVHGTELLDMGYSVDEVVHDYGDLCQAITDLAVERDAPFQIDEFRTLNRCLDNAIADAVTEFSYQKELRMADRFGVEANERAVVFADELRGLLSTASLAFAATKAGNLSLGGATGTILERSLAGLLKAIEGSLEDVRTVGTSNQVLSSFSLSELVAEVAAAGQMAAQQRPCTLTLGDIDPTLAVSGNRELLTTALAGLLQNAIKFTQLQTEVILSAYAAADRIQIDISDHCGGLAPGAEKTMLLPYSKSGGNRNTKGLGLTIAQQSVTACGGTLHVRNLPGIGCVFTVSLPRLSLPT